MTSPDRAALVDHARRTIAQGSKSFRFASRLFDRRTRERVWLLYAWCRACDDLADGQSLGHDARLVADPAQRLDYLRSRTERALAGESGLDAPFEGLRLLLEECRLPRHLIEDHLAGYARDAGGWSPGTEADLLSYCYQVAGTVGCMMAIIMGVSPDDRDTLDRASDLGIAFQLANIARDIGEDHRLGRCYLPLAWLEEVGLGRGELMEPGHRDRLAALAGRLHRLVETYQASARVGAARLPLRSRWAVLSAARIYGAIGARVVEREGAAWDSRTVIPRSQKLNHVVRAAGEALLPPRPVLRSGLWDRRV